MTETIMHMIHPLEIEPGEIGSTVRRGTKWSGHEDAYVSLCVCPKRTDHKIVGEGRIISCWTGVFVDVPARFLQYEHERSSREYRGLLGSMRRAYGEDFEQSETVTALIYERLT